MGRPLVFGAALDFEAPAWVLPWAPGPHARAQSAPVGAGASPGGALAFTGEGGGDTARIDPTPVRQYAARVVGRRPGAPVRSAGGGAQAWGAGRARGVVARWRVRLLEKPQTPHALRTRPQLQSIHPYIKIHLVRLALAGLACPGRERRLLDAKPCIPAKSASRGLAPSPLLAALCSPSHPPSPPPAPASTDAKPLRSHGQRPAVPSCAQHQCMPRRRTTPLPAQVPPHLQYTSAAASFFPGNVSRSARRAAVDTSA